MKKNGLNKFYLFYSIVFFFFVFVKSVHSQEDSKKVARQNPSPMIENVREHERINKVPFDGIDYKIFDILKAPIEVYIPVKSQEAKEVNLLIHFHGSSIPVKYAVDKQDKNFIAAIINLGTGSKVYYNQFEDSTLFLHIIDIIKKGFSRNLNHDLKINNIILSGFSAGYGAVKKILSSEKNYQAVSGILLLDGLHASYIPEEKVLYEGGKIDSTAYSVFLRFAKDAVNQKDGKKFLFTHTEIFPGTFVSTTESADFLLKQLNIHAKPVLNWGPIGMQQLSDAKKGSFEIMGFAGNTAPDHVDHLEAMYAFLKILMNL